MSSGGVSSQLVRTRQNRPEVWRAFWISGCAASTQGALSLGELPQQRGQPGDGWLWSLLQRGEQRGDEQPFLQPALPSPLLRPGGPRHWSDAVLQGGKRSHSEAVVSSLRPRGSPVPTPLRKIRPDPQHSRRRWPLEVGASPEDQGDGKAAAMTTDGCFGSTSGLCVRERQRHLFSSLWKEKPTCLCLAVSVLNQSSPMMNVKKNVRKCCHTVLYIFNDFLLEPRVRIGTLWLTYLHRLHLRWGGAEAAPAWSAGALLSGLYLGCFPLQFSQLRRSFFPLLVVWMMRVVRITSALGAVKWCGRYQKKHHLPFWVHADSKL